MTIIKYKKHIFIALISALCAVVVLHFIPISNINYQQQLNGAEAKMQHLTREEGRFYALTDATIAAAELGQVDKARIYAEDLLLLSEHFHGNWNYGNAVHYGHIALGIVFLSNENIEDAVMHLHDAGRTPGSPQLNTAGPDMRLARRLLMKGQRDAVLVYLEECRRFWELGETRLTIWSWEIRFHLIPAFNKR